MSRNKWLRRGFAAVIVLVLLLGAAYAFIMWEGSSARGNAPALRLFAGGVVIEEIQCLLKTQILLHYIQDGARSSNRHQHRLPLQRLVSVS